MKYSDKILKDDNFDDELEKLIKITGECGIWYDTFVEKLDDSFELQTHDLGFEEWVVTYGLRQDISAMHAGISQACQNGKLAYEFGNGFIVLNFVYVL